MKYKKLATPVWAIVLSVIFTGCEPAATTNSTAGTVTNAGINNVNRTANNLNVNLAVTNEAAGSSAAAATIDTREPEQYEATVLLKLETMGVQNSVLPQITAQVARGGANRRMEFALPNGEKVIYLDRADKRLLILPARREFAELNQESLGFDLRKMMTPGQIVAQAKNFKNVQVVGEEQFNSRTATKYRYNASTNTNTTAGNVAAETFVLVDKETGLPLRSETVAQSDKGDVKGIKGVRLVTEMSNIQTAVKANLFEAPANYKQIPPEQVRGQVNAIFSVAAGLFGQLLQTAQPNNQTANQPAQPTTTTKEN